ncbi:DUF1800 domain-containing protein [Cellulophaga sp. F20128]|uniref:DUF1800 domain-containing protein n=1 Tax=Cellulophaga sp. F20128 TaxID=2926413 RepID=UPI001FF12EAD|nr:DUF1800 domain-containing protein [Cellulophaga sp. F20128]MCK0155675.1 DUF1800 domain-containing protein [Cellulophaga sp. F20128]
MEYFVNCNSASLNPIGGTLDKQKAEHLFRRLGFSASVTTINTAIGQPISAYVDNLIAEAITMPPQTAPIWADWTGADYPADDDARNQLHNQQRTEFYNIYVSGLVTNNLRDRLSFFWSNHFVTEYRNYQANPFLYRYVDCLQRNAIGNFKTFVSEIGLTDAMLYYLDGVYNNGNNPNENYARELYELFTLGEGNNYTEEDIIETAKALTGYVERGDESYTPVTFDPTKHDAGSKTIFGQTDTFDYDGVIDNLFDERTTEISWFICKKLYEFFVHPDSDDEENNGNAKQVIDELATTFRTSGFEIAAVLSQLFKSEHFFDDEAIGVIIKSPFDIYINLLNETSFTYDDAIIANIANTCRLIGQEMFNPPGVEGWYRDRTWINTNFMIGRWLSSEMFLQLFYTNNPDEFFDFAVSLTPNPATESNPDVVTMAILDKLLPKGIADDQLQNAYDVFRDDALTQYYAAPEGNGSWSLYNYEEHSKQQIYFLLLHIIRQPEFQLK